MPHSHNQLFTFTRWTSPSPCPISISEIDLNLIQKSTRVFLQEASHLGDNSRNSHSPRVPQTYSKHPHHLNFIPGILCSLSQWREMFALLQRRAVLEGDMCVSNFQIKPAWFTFVPFLGKGHPVRQTRERAAVGGIGGGGWSGSGWVFALPSLLVWQRVFLFCPPPPPSSSAIWNSNLT